MSIHASAPEPNGPTASDHTHIRLVRTTPEPRWTADEYSTRVESPSVLHGGEPVITYEGVFGSGAEKLAASGIAPVVARGRGYRYLDDANWRNEFKRLGLEDGRTTPHRTTSKFACNGGVMVMPWFSIEFARAHTGPLTTKPWTELQLRPTNPRGGEDGKSKMRKYEFLPGAKTPIDVHPCVPASWKESAPVIVFVEGLLKADSTLTAYLESLGLGGELDAWDDLTDEEARVRLAKVMEGIEHEDQVLIYAVAGAYNWQSNPEWDTIPKLDGREAWVALDGDIATNRQVWGAARKLVDRLQDAKRATVKIVDLSDVKDADGHRVGMDDFFALGHEWSDVLARLTDKLPKQPEPEFDLSLLNPEGAAPTGAVSEWMPSAANATALTVPHPDLCRKTVHRARTEYGLVERWEDHYGDHFKFVPFVGWRRWTGTVWAPAESADLIATMIAVVRAAAAFESAYLPPEDETGSTPRADHVAWAQSLEKHRTLSAAVKLAEAIPGIRIADEAWDADLDIVNTPRGEFNCATKEFTSHNPAHLITRITNGSGYPPNKKPGEVDALDLLLDGYDATDPHISAFIGTVAGVAITGYSPRMFCHIWGVAGSGKSSFWDACAHAFGTYAQTVSIDVLQERHNANGEGPTPILHRMRNARLVYVDEGSKKRLAENLMKTLTAGGTTTTRTLHGEAVTWRSQITLVMSGNGRLLLPDNDDGITRRFYPVRLTARPKKDDPTIKEHLMSQEGADAVLWFALENAHRWVKAGHSVEALNPPQVVLNERSTYLAELDPLAGWFDEMVDVLETPVETAESPILTDLHKSLSQWCREHNVRWTVGLKEFEQRLAEKGHHASPGRGPMRTGPGGKSRRGRFVDTLRLVSSGPRYAASDY